MTTLLLLQNTNSHQKEPKAYQSEEDLERFLIKELTLQGYERLN